MNQVIGTVCVRFAFLIHVYTRYEQKITFIFKYLELRIFDFHIFFSVMLVHMSYIYVDNMTFWIVSLFLTDKKVSLVLVWVDILNVKKIDFWLKKNIEKFSRRSITIWENIRNSTPYRLVGRSEGPLSNRGSRIAGLSL